MTTEKKDNGMAKWGLTLSILGGILIPLLIGIGTLIVGLKSDIATLNTQIADIKEIKANIKDLWQLGNENRNRIGQIEAVHGYHTNSTTVPNTANDRR